MNKKEEINHSTYLKKEQEKNIKNFAEKLTNDPDKEIREKLSLCKICYYREGVLAGQAFTHRNCSFCEKEEVYPTTNTDSLCHPCAKKNNCCKHCSADLDYLLRK